jgi:pyruvate dehydrogenase E1 component alpha subunit
VLLEDGTIAPKAQAGVEPADVVALYRAMVRARGLDDRLLELSKAGRIGFHVSFRGDEALVLGTAFATRPSDWIFPSHRELGAALWRGMPLSRYFDDLFGNQRGPGLGRQMPDQFASREAHVASPCAPLGAQLTQAVGLSWAAKTRKDDAAALVYFGETATSSGDFHSALNFAGVFKTPTVFVCRVQPGDGPRVSDKGIAYGVSAVRVDAEDVFAVIKVTREAIQRGVAGRGATLIEAELPERPEPLARVRRYLERTAAFGDAHDQKLRAELESDLEQAIREAEAVPSAEAESLFEQVYAELPWHLSEQRRQMKGTR